MEFKATEKVLSEVISEHWPFTALRILYYINMGNLIFFYLVTYTISSILTRSINCTHTNYFAADFTSSSY